VTTDLWISIGLLVLVSAFVVVTGIRRQPGIGVIVAALLIGISLYFRKRGLETIGFYPPTSWLATVLWSLGLGIVLGFAGTLVIEPASERLTEEPLDLSQFKKLRGNWRQLLLMLAVAWILAAFLEESIFRGFLITELGWLIGFKGVGASIALLLSAIVFGFAHWYQGKGGALSAAVMGFLIGDIFIWSGYNLWMPILTHAVIDAVGLLLIYFNADTRLKKLLWKDKK
jgi:membrane protease YdiL (CAAX protease family)